jgi:hypothetical protein
MTIAADVEPESVRGMFRTGATRKDGDEELARPAKALDSRAWILQEQILSTRLLTFQEDEIYWDCSGISASGSHPDGFKFLNRMESGRDSKLRQLRRYISGLDLDNSRLSENIHGLWMQVVTEYTRRDLMIEHDRLVALLGVAQAIQHQTGDDMVAGLSTKYLAWQLLWWVLPEDPKIYHWSWKAPFPFSRRGNPAYARPMTYKAPSWSWASVLGPVTYARVTQFFGSEEDLHRVNLDLVPNAYAEVQVKDVTVDVESSGYNLSGTVTMSGSLMRASAIVSHDTPMLRSDSICRSCD